MEDYAKRIALAWLVVAVLYANLSLGVYALRHPEQTTTQVFLNIADALRWR